MAFWWIFVMSLMEMYAVCQSFDALFPDKNTPRYISDSPCMWTGSAKSYCLGSFQ